MKILQIIHKIQNRGAETFTCQLSNHLIALGHEINIIALYSGPVTLPFHGEIIILNQNTSNRFFDYQGWKKISQVISEYQPDIVQANAGDTLKYAVISKKLFNWKQPLVFRNASEVGSYLKSPLQKGLNKFLYKNVDWVISVSQASKKDIVKHFPFLREKVDVVGVGLEKLENPESRVLDPKGYKHIVHVGGFSFEKNHKALIQIFQLILKKQPLTHLHLVGDGPLKLEIEELVRTNSLQNQVSFYGFVNNPLSYIKGADMLVLPSIIEGLPGVILEAMICKIPVVAFDVGGISEILNENTGSLISKGDNVSFSNAILQILNTKNTLQIEFAYKMVSSNFMNTDIALKFVNSYNKLVMDKQ